MADSGAVAGGDDDAAITLTLSRQDLLAVAAALEADRPPKRTIRLKLVDALVAGTGGAVSLSECGRLGHSTQVIKYIALVCTTFSQPMAMLIIGGSCVASYARLFSSLGTDVWQRLNSRNASSNR